ncbi:MAG: nucleotidyltransferase family protein [Caulobacteraceae bacterium]
MTQRAPAPRALVLAAGLGSRIRSVAGDRPKPLLPLGGEPILARNLRWLAESGVREVWINLHYAGEAIRAEIGDGSTLGLNISYVHEPDLLGTAGALANIADVFTQTMLVVYGDSLVRLDLQALRDRHAASGAVATLALFDQDRNLHTGIAGGRVLLDAADYVTAFVEGGDPAVTGGLVNAGVYLVEPTVLDFIPRGRLVDFGREVFPALLAQGRPLAGHVIEPAGYCLGLDTPESFAAGERLLDQGRLTA